MQSTVTSSSSEPELKKGSVCEIILAKLEQEAAIAVSEAAALREAFDKKYTINGKLPWGLLYGDRSNLQFDIDIGVLNAAESRANEAEWRVKCSKPTTDVADEPVRRLTAYGKIFQEQEDLRQDLYFYDIGQSEYDKRMDALRSRVCRYHRYEGVIGEIEPGKWDWDKKQNKEVFWESGCAFHDHGDQTYHCYGIHIGPIYEEDTHSSSQPVAEVSAADCQQENRVEVGATPTTSSADGNAPRDTSTAKESGKKPVNPRRKRRDVVRATLTASSADGKCTSGHVEEKPLLTPAVITVMGVSAGGAQREGEHLLAGTDKPVILGNVLPEEQTWLENHYVEQEILREMDEEIAILEQEHPEMQEITVNAMFKVFRVWEQQRTFWEALVKGIQGKLKCVKKVNERAGKSRSDLEARLNEYYIQYFISAAMESHYEDIVNSMVPGLLDFHIEEDRKFWFKMQKLGVLDETIEAFLGRRMTGQEKDDLLHSQERLRLDLEKFGCGCS